MGDGGAPPAPAGGPASAPGPVPGADPVPADALGGGRRERRKAENRAAIVAAAVEAFTELGYGATTVRDVVRRTSLAAGTFYNYFPDKQAILEEIVGEHVREAAVRMRDARTAATSTGEALELGAAAYFRLVTERPELLALFARNTGTLRASADEHLLQPLVEELRVDLERLLAESPSAVLDTDLLARAVIGAGLEVATRFVERGGGDPEEAVAVIRALFVDGVLGRPPATPTDRPPATPTDRPPATPTDRPPATPTDGPPAA